MKRSRTVWSVLSAAALVMVAGACGSSVSGPTAVEPAMGATIQGTVQAASAALNVSVTGTALSATTDPVGRFTLSGVPAGTATLRFTGSGVDAQLQVSGLAAGQVTSINVQVSGTQAVLAPAPSATPSPSPTPSPNPTPSPGPTPSPSPSPGDEDDVELRGAIQSVNAPNLTVSGRLIRTNGSTRILDSNNNPTGFASLRAGLTVEVEGASQSDGSVLAFKVKIEDAGDDNPGGGGQVEFRGGIQSISAPNLTVAGRLVRTTGSTVILDDRNNPIGFGSLRVGQTVEVEGTAQGDGSVAAKKIKIED